MIAKKYGEFGGTFVPELLMPVLEELEKAWNEAKDDPTFWHELSEFNKYYTGRPSPLYYAKRLTAHVGGAKIYLKREDLNHTGAHKINHCLGQAILAKRMGKTRIIAETGAGQHGVASATVCSLLDLPCIVYQGEIDTIRQRPNVFRMKLLGAEVRPVTSGSRTLKDAVNSALQDWAANVHDTYYLLGSVVGPHPFPEMVGRFQSIISEEIKIQHQELENKLPDAVIACVGGGSNAYGSFANFIEDESVKLIGVEAAGLGLDTDKHAGTISRGTVGVFHGMKSYFIQDDDGQIIEPHSISAGLDYPGVGPVHSHLHDIGRAEYQSATDKEALDAFQLLCKIEGIIPALESSHAVAYAMKYAKTRPKTESIVINLSGRGDKDIFTVAEHLGEEL